MSQLTKFSLGPFVSLAFLLASAPAMGQSLYKAKAPSPLDFKYLLVAKSSAFNGEPAIKFLIPGFRKDEYPTTKLVAFKFPETRTRSVNTSTGVETKEYTAIVAQQEEVTTVRYEFKPFHDQEIVFTDTIHAWTLKGDKLTTTALTQRLKNPTHVFVLSEFLSQQELQGDRSAIEPYYRQVLKDDVLLLYSADLTAYFYSQIPLTIINESRRSVTLYFVEDDGYEVKFTEDFKPDEQGMRRTVEATEGTEFLAKVNDRIVSKFRVPNEQHSYWKIGPLVEDTSWEGDNGVSFQLVRGRSWRQTGRNPEFAGALEEVERTDQWIGLRHSDSNTFIQLGSEDAAFLAPDAEDWQQLSIRAR